VCARSSRIPRIFSPTRVAPGSLKWMAAIPRDSSSPRSARVWVDLPQPSGPSSTMKRPSCTLPPANTPGHKKRARTRITRDSRAAPGPAEGVGPNLRGGTGGKKNPVWISCAEVRGVVADGAILLPLANLCQADANIQKMPNFLVTAEQIETYSMKTIILTLSPCPPPGMRAANRAAIRAGSGESTSLWKSPRMGAPGTRPIGLNPRNPGLPGRHRALRPGAGALSGRGNGEAGRDPHRSCQLTGNSGIHQIALPNCLSCAFPVDSGDQDLPPAIMRSHHPRSGNLYAVRRADGFACRESVIPTVC